MINRSICFHGEMRKKILTPSFICSYITHSARLKIATDSFCFLFRKKYGLAVHMTRPPA